MDRRALERLGHYIVSRRVALGYRNRTDLADSLQFTLRTLADIVVALAGLPVIDHVEAGEIVIL